ncbi:unnamed protein product [Gemmataceae bacterium]|nr:unnamed protein product [Gemmataceae bacterium]VTT99523.1 unnamed protein product [Gemmataceae bacterium]
MSKHKSNAPHRKRQSNPQAVPPGPAGSRSPQHSGPAAPVTQEPPAGLNEAHQAAVQRSAHGGEVLREGLFATFMATALNLDKFFDARAYRIYLANVLRDLGDPKDPIERMLIEQLCLAHFRVAQLHGAAGQANGLEGTKLLNTVTARMLGEMRRTALSLKAYRTTAVPTNRQKAELKLFKAAQ